MLMSRVAPAIVYLSMSQAESSKEGFENKIDKMIRNSMTSRPTKHELGNTKALDRVLNWPLPDLSSGQLHCFPSFQITIGVRYEYTKS